MTPRALLTTRKRQPLLGQQVPKHGLPALERAQRCNQQSCVGGKGDQGT